MASYKHCLLNTWFSLLLFGLICMGAFRVFQDPKHHRLKPLHRNQRQLQNILSTSETPTLVRSVTRSIFDLKTVPYMSDHVLFFNRVPKSGSEMLVLLLQWLQGANGFHHVRLPHGDRRFLGAEEQKELVNNMEKMIMNEAVPVSFDRHVYFLNFTKFNHQSPTYINLVRDPVDKAISRFYYGRVTPNPRNPDVRLAPKRTHQSVTAGTFEDCVTDGMTECTFINNKPYDLTIPYFCGHDDRCMLLNNKWALNEAMKNVDRYYPVVGVLEELNATLSALETKLPRFFHGVQKMYFEELMEPHKNANRRRPKQIDKEVRDRLTRILYTEYEFYWWLRKRLLDQQNEVT